LLAERLRASIGSEPIQDSAVSISVTASLGVSTTLNAKGADQVLRATDEALYTAKIQGRNRVVAKPSSEGVLLMNESNA
jgi:diguanylate cyclase (GGDEF)-like protein